MNTQKPPANRAEKPYPQAVSISAQDFVYAVLHGLVTVVRLRQSADAFIAIPPESLNDLTG